MIDGAKKPTTPSLFDDFGSSRFKSKDEYKNALVSYQEALFHVQQSYYHQKKRCLLYTSPSPRDGLLSRMPSSA